MKKLLTIAWKDLLITFRDPSALIMMLVTPFALTLAMAFAFGGLGSGGNTNITKMTVVIVNQDNGEFGQIMVDVFRSQDLADMINPVIMADGAAARAEVDADKATAAVIIPSGFSTTMMATAPDRQQAIVEIYRNPARPVTTGIVRSIVTQVLDRMTAAVASGNVTLSQLIASGSLSPQQVMAQSQQIAERAARQISDTPLVTLKTETTQKRNGTDFDWLTYMAPSMAIMFLMFTVSNGGRSLLAERDWGTLPRLLTTPTAAVHVIGGKVAGIYLTGLAQMSILILTSSLLFRVQWGSALAVALLTMALVAAATGFGAALAAYARTAGQANQVGTMIALVFGMLAGNFFPRPAMPSWMRTIGYVTPNAWGIEGFSSLSAGGGLADVMVPIVALLIMAAVLCVVATVAFRRQYA